MKTSQLIEILKELPQDADIVYLYDGWCTCEIEGAYFAQGGEVILIDDGVVYHDENRPIGAPGEKDDRYFHPYKKSI
jgi:hypothetical protein